MPRIVISEQDVDPKNTDRLRRKLQGAYDQLYDQLAELEKLKAQVAAQKPDGLTPTERSILRALMLGSTQNAAAPQTAVIPIVSALPPTTQSTPGQLVDFSGTVYIFIDITTGWITLTAAATAHNLLSATHSDTLAAAVVRGDLVVGNATPKWSRFALGAAKLGLRVNAGATDPEWSDQVAMLDVVQTFLNAAHTFKGTAAPSTLASFEGANGFYAQIVANFEEFNVSTVAAFTDSSVGLLSSGSEILLTGYRIVTAITGPPTTISLGDAATPTRFLSATAVAGVSGMGVNMRKGGVATDAAGPTQSGAAAARVTFDAVPTGGRVRVHVLSLVWNAPTS